MKKIITSILPFILMAISAAGQCNLTVNAGLDVTTCSGGSVMLTAYSPGATSYTWQPANGLSSQTIANPNASPVKTTMYSVKAVDSKGCTATDSVIITVKPRPIADAGKDTTYCAYSSSTVFMLYGNAKYADSISWRPFLNTGSLNDNLSLNPVFTRAEGDMSQTFSFILDCISFAGCYDADTVTISFPKPPMVDAGPDQNLKDTSVVSLNGNASNTTVTTWSSTGSGTFYPSTSDLKTSYYASPSDLINGEVTFILNPQFIPACYPFSDTLLVKFNTGLKITGSVKQLPNKYAFNVFLFQLQSQIFELVDTKYLYSSMDFSFSGLTYGTYLLQVQPENINSGLLPTYFIEDTSWINAYRIIMTDASITSISISPKNFVSADQLAFKGNDVIEGHVTEAPENNVRTSGLTPIPHATIYLLNSKSEILAYTYSDENGHFSFTDLIKGTYTLHVDYAGAQVEYVTSEVDGNPATSTTSDFRLQKSVITGISKNGNLTTSKIQVYPNPSKDVLFIKNLEGASQITIYDLMGKVMLETNVEGSATPIAVDALPQGMYMAEIVNNHHVTQQKFIKAL